LVQIGNSNKIKRPHISGSFLNREVYAISCTVGYNS
jgi:hypothetical protein